MSRITCLKRRSSRRKCSVQKPNGILHPRVEKVGPQHFGVICFDCHKATSKWMLADFYGKLLVEPTKIHHTRPELELVVERMSPGANSSGVQMKNTGSGESCRSRRT
jgi:hypothetical protein